MGLVQRIRTILEELTSKNFQKTGSQQDFLRVGEEIGSFSIIPRVYEAELDNKYGIKLEDLKNGIKSSIRSDLENNVFFNESGNYSVDEIAKRILKKYKGVPGFCSMRIGDEKELMKHLKRIHKLSYIHYVFGKENNLKGQFPKWCCGYSARNLLLTLMENGYPNASFLNNTNHDHTYNGLPFLFGDNEKRGFIVVDPTSDQLFNDKIHAPRNSLFVVFGTRWKYETDWNGGSDLFPKETDSSRFSNLHTLRTNPSSTIYESVDIVGYFSGVFRNPVDVKIDDI